MQYLKIGGLGDQRLGYFFILEYDWGLGDLGDLGIERFNDWGNV